MSIARTPDTTTRVRLPPLSSPPEVGISAGVGVIISLIGTIGFIIAGWPYQDLMPPLSLGYVSLIGFALMGPVSAFFAPYGARIAHALSRRKLEIAFGVFLWIIAARFVASLIW